MLKIFFLFLPFTTRGNLFFCFSGTYAGGGGAENWPKKYNIDYFGLAVNLEFKIKLHFDEDGW